MLDVCLLGTGGMMPLPYRRLTALMTRYNGSSLLIDCGEGTQVGIREVGWSVHNIDMICFTHFHGDHIGGLPGLLLTMGNAQREEPLVLVGPKGLEKVVNALRVIAPELPFELIFWELTDKKHTLEYNGYHIQAFKVNHGVTCYGYRIDIKRQGKFDVEAAKALSLPVQLWGQLQRGQKVVYNNQEYVPEMVMGKERKGISLVYCTDTRPTLSLEEAAKEVDLFICEGMYGDWEKFANAKEHKHMMMQEAATIACKANVGQLYFTHYSPAMAYPKDYIKEVRKIFPSACLGEELKVWELGFEDE